MDNDTDLKERLKALTTENKKLQTERDRAIKQAQQVKSNMSHNNVAMTWLNDHEAIGNHLAYSPLGWLMYSNDEGIWQAPDIGKIRRALKDTFLINGKHSVTTRDINSAIGLAADQVSRQGANDWNDNPNVIICKNNNLNLDTMQTSEHDHSLYATSKLNANYNPDFLETDRGLEWLKMMALFFTDKTEFVQEFIGYSITTDTSNDVSIWLQSLAGGGKSTFLRAIESMMGGRCGTLNLSLLNKKGEESTHVLIGKTLVVAEEVGNKATLERADILKQIIDGGDVGVKRMRKDIITVKSRCKVLWSMNRIPTIPAQDGSVDRRVKIVTMEVIPLEDRDPKIRERAENGFYNDVVLTWAVEGLKRLRERGRFDIPDIVKNNSSAQIKSYDVEAQFIKEKCIHIPGFWIETKNRRGLGLCEQSRDLQKAYNDFCDETDYKWKKSTGSLRQDWLRLFGSDRTIEKRNRIYYLDVKIIPQNNDTYFSDDQDIDDNDYYFNNEVEFIKNTLELNEGGSVEVEYLHGLYEGFCNNNGCEFNLGKFLKVLGWCGIVSKVLGDGDKKPHYVNLTLL